MERKIPVRALDASTKRDGTKSTYSVTSNDPIVRTKVYEVSSISFEIARIL